MRRVVALQTTFPVTIQPGPDVVIQADADQLEQLLINLLRNAIDAAEETQGAVRVGWEASDNHLEVVVDDEGPGCCARLELPLRRRLSPVKRLKAATVRSG